MRSSILAFAVTISSVVAQTPTPDVPAVIASEGSLGLGAKCSDDVQCAGGAQCYGTTAFTIKTCGSFNAGCQGDDQCATNTCQDGICSGFLASSLYRIASTSPTASSTAGSTSSVIPAQTTGGGIQAAPSATVVAAPGTLALGAECAMTEQCAGGVECFASNAWGIKQCGKFNAACTSDEQCATNTCSDGICSGILASSLWRIPTASSTSASASSSIATGGIQIAPSATVVASPRTLKLGAECATTEQCAGGAECFASTAWQIKSCGKFNAACTSDAQCATNSCNSGLCNGFLASSLWNAVPATTSSTASSFVSSVAMNTANGTAIVPTRSATASLAVFTGGVSKGGVGAGAVLAAAALVVAL